MVNKYENIGDAKELPDIRCHIQNKANAMLSQHGAIKVCKAEVYKF